MKETKKMKSYFWIWQNAKLRMCSLFGAELWGPSWLLRVSVFMFSKMDGKTRFQRSSSSKRGLNYLFHLPDVLQKFGRAPAAEVGHVFLRPFGACYLAVGNDYWKAEGSWRRSSSMRYHHIGQWDITSSPEVLWAPHGPVLGKKVDTSWNQQLETAKRFYWWTQSEVFESEALWAPLGRCIYHYILFFFFW